jgi:CRP-like cAMP-binding protein
VALVPSRQSAPLVPTAVRTGAGGGFAPTALDAVARRCPEQDLAAGQCLFQEGAALTDVYIVRRGVVGLGRRAQGRRMTFLLLRSGDIVGDVAALLGGVALFDAFAVTEARVVAVPAAAFVEALDLRSPFSRQWAVGLGERLSALQARLEDVLGGDLRSRIASLLHHELEAGSRVVSLTQQTIADLLGVPRTSVTRTLQGLHRQGIVDVGYGHIAIRDPAALAAAAGRAGPTLHRRGHGG